MMHLCVQKLFIECLLCVSTRPWGYNHEQNQRHMHYSVASQRLLISALIIPGPNCLDRVINSEILGRNWPTKLESYMLQHSLAGLVMGGAQRWIWNIELRQIWQEGRGNHMLKHTVILARKGIFIFYLLNLSQYTWWLDKANNIPILELEN